MEFEIKKNIGVLSTAKSGWTTELNIVSWNKNDGKLDIRSWNPEHDKCGKGITLTQEEAKALYELLNVVVNGEKLNLEKE